MEVASSFLYSYRSYSFNGFDTDLKANKEKIYQQIVVASLLGDGLSSCVVMGALHPGVQAITNNNILLRGSAPTIVDTYSFIAPETQDCLGSELLERWLHFVVII